MASANANKVVSIQLNLNEIEARHLMALTQNYYGSGRESDQATQARAAIFNALQAALGGIDDGR